MKIMSVDPGSKNTGWVVIENGKLTKSGKGFSSLKKDLDKSIDILIVENYSPQPYRGGADTKTARLIEGISFYAAERKIPLILQSPSLVKKTFSDRDICFWLKIQGIDKKFNKHIRDAIKHALYYEKIKKVKRESGKNGKT